MIRPTVEKHDVDIRMGIQFAPPIAADGDQGTGADVLGGNVGLDTAIQIAQQGIDRNNFV